MLYRQTFSKLVLFELLFSLTGYINKVVLPSSRNFYCVIEIHRTLKKNTILKNKTKNLHPQLAICRRQIHRLYLWSYRPLLFYPNTNLQKIVNIVRKFNK
jgi:hypothetical protein